VRQFFLGLDSTAEFFPSFLPFQALSLAEQLLEVGGVSFASVYSNCSSKETPPYSPSIPLFHKISFFSPPAFPFKPPLPLSMSRRVSQVAKGFWAPVPSTSPWVAHQKKFSFSFYLNILEMKATAQRVSPPLHRG